MFEEIVGSDDDNRLAGEISDNEIRVEDFLNAQDDVVLLDEKSTKLDCQQDSSDVVFVDQQMLHRNASAERGHPPRSSLEAVSRLSVRRPKNKNQLLSRPFKEILEIAQRNIASSKTQKVLNIDDGANSESGTTSRSCSTSKTDSTSSVCWASKYRPTKFTHLISDDMINRLVLKWMKLWDPFIFKSSTPSFANTSNYSIISSRINLAKKREFKSSYELKMEKLLEFDEHSLLPRFRILLINGEPGMGKTMLVNIVAKHCGYEVMEINASDERTPENFKALFTKTANVKRSINSGKPICLVFDEIDGAPKKSIDILLQYGLGELEGSSKKSTKINHRPIICICNNLFSPCLYKLKQNAFVINFPPISHSKIVQLLKKIISNEVPDMALKDDYLYGIVSDTNGDIRSSINTLQFNVLGRPKNVAHLGMDLMSKDRQLSLYDMWNQTFQTSSKAAAPPPKPFERISNLVSQCSVNADRYVYGLFDNYCHLLDIPSRHRHFHIEKRIDTCAYFFVLNDLISTTVNRYQQYGPLYGLRNAIVAYALHVALSYDRTKHSHRFLYPANYYQNIDILNRNKELMSRFQTGTSGRPTREVVSTAAGSSTYDLVYYVASLIQPPLKNINVYMMTQNEKLALKNAASILLEKNITIKTYQNQLLSANNQNPSESFTDFQFDPNIRLLCSYPGVIRRKPVVSENAMQLLKTTMEALSMESKPNKIRSTFDLHGDNSMESVSNSRLILKTIEGNFKSKPAYTPKRDFFGRKIDENSPNSNNLEHLAKENLENAPLALGEKSKVKFDRHLYYVYKQGSATRIVRRTKLNDIIME